MLPATQLNSAWPSLHGESNENPLQAAMSTDTPHDALAPYPWSRSVIWCLAQSYGKGDQCHPMSWSAC